jgi:hypothetical protein
MVYLHYASTAASAGVLVVAGWTALPSETDWPVRMLTTSASTMRIAAAASASVTIVGL